MENENELKELIFEKWLNKNQVHHLDLHIGVFGDDELRGVYSTRDITAHQNILRVPQALVLSTQTIATDHPLHPIIQQYQLDDWSGLVVLLMYERANPQSLYKPWLDLFPSEYHTPVTWKDETLQLIQGTNLYSPAREWNETIKSGYERLSSIFQYHPQVFNSWVHTLELFFWAADSVRSRAFEIARGVPALVPLGDMLNTVDMNFDERPLSEHFFRNGYFELAVLRSVKANEQIFISYGEKTNTEFLLHYGMVVHNNPFDSIQLRVSPNFDPVLAEMGSEIKLELGILDLGAYQFSLKLRPPPTTEHLLIKFCLMLARRKGVAATLVLAKILTITVQRITFHLEHSKTVEKPSFVENLLKKQDNLMLQILQDVDPQGFNLQNNNNNNQNNQNNNNLQNNNNNNQNNNNLQNNNNNNQNENNNQNNNNLQNNNNNQNENNNNQNNNNQNENNNNQNNNQNENNQNNNNNQNEIIDSEESDEEFNEDAEMAKWYVYTQKKLLLEWMAYSITMLCE